MKFDYIHFMLVDDHQLIQDSFKLTRGKNRFQVIADCDNGNAAPEQVQTFKHDIMLVDIPGQNDFISKN